MYRFFLILTVVLFYNLSLHGQNPSINGRFEADYIAGCTPLKVVLTETDTFPPETVRQYDFNGDGVFVGFDSTEEISYIYNQAGIYNIVQVINRDIIPKTDTLKIEVYSSVNPDFSIFTCENNGVSIDIDPDQYEQHRIIYSISDSITLNQGQQASPFYYAPGTYTIKVKGLYNNGRDNCGLSQKNFTTIQNLVAAGLNEIYLTRKDNITGSIQVKYSLTPDVVFQLERAVDYPAGFTKVSYLDNNSSSFTIDSINTGNKINIFRIAAYDACQKIYLYSDTASSVILEATAENNRNHLFWSRYNPDFDHYEIYKNGLLLKSIQDETPAVYNDNEVVCFTNYCYYVAEIGKNGIKSYSDTACVEAYKIYFPPPIKNTTASVSENGIELAWDPVPSAVSTGFFIQRFVSEDVYSTIDTVDVTHYTDTVPDIGPQSYCYRISYLDECRNRSNLGDLACSIGLSIEDNKSLGWTKYLGWENGVNRYLLEVYNEQGELEDEIDMGQAEAYAIQDPLKQEHIEYRIRAESNDTPVSVAYSNFVVKDIEPMLWLPNAFTPNGDGLNDTFHPEGTIMQEYNMKIFTRYGKLIYETNDQLAGWDGTWDGKEVPFSTYIYKLNAVDENGKHYNLTGEIVLIRE